MEVNPQQTAHYWIEHLNLLPHPEGGYFREVYRSGSVPMRTQGRTDPKGDCLEVPTTGAKRNWMTSIFWLVTADSPIGWWCQNRSDHVHYFHAGWPLTYHLARDGTVKQAVLGDQVEKEQTMQLVVEGGWWKAAQLKKGEFCLLGEAVAPGFDFSDFRWGEVPELKQVLGTSFDAMQHLIRPAPETDFGQYYPER